MKGIILAAGKGTRLYPMTLCISKQLLPIYDKPMIYYPLSVLMMAGIREILLIVSQEDLPIYKKLFGDGSQIGLDIKYSVQYVQKGIADAFIIGEEFIGDDRVCLILGDNIFWGTSMQYLMEKGLNTTSSATVYAYNVRNPKDFGVVEFNNDGKAISIEEKPQLPKSNFAVTGLYFYDNSVIEIAKKIPLSPRGELEITTVNNEYLKNDDLSVVAMDKNIQWFDTGSADGILKASKNVEKSQKQQMSYIACIEEIAYYKGFINKNQLISLGEKLFATNYGKYILEVAQN